MKLPMFQRMNGIQRYLYINTTITAMMIMCKPVFHDCPHPCAYIDILIDFRTGIVIGTSGKVLVKKACVAVVVDTLLNNVFFDALTDIVPAGALTDADVLITVRVDIEVDTLRDALAVKIPGVLPPMGVDILTAIDANKLVAVMTALEFTLSSVLLETPLLSCCAPCSCWPMTLLDCDRALQAWKPSDHL